MQISPFTKTSRRLNLSELGLNQGRLIHFELVAAGGVTVGVAEAKILRDGVISLDRRGEPVDQSAKVEGLKQEAASF